MPKNSIYPDFLITFSTNKNFSSPLLYHQVMGISCILSHAAVRPVLFNSSTDLIPNLLIIHFLFDISYQAVQKILTLTTAFCCSCCILYFLKCLSTIFNSILNHSICYISAMTCFFTSIRISTSPNVSLFFNVSQLFYPQLYL